MSFDPHANLAYSLVAVAPAPDVSGTSLTVSAGDGALFPDPSGIGYELTVWPIAAFPLITNAEIVRVTAKVGDVLTIVRTQGGTSARAIVVGDQIALTVTKKVVEDIETVLAAPVLISAGASSASVSALTFSNSNGISFGLSDGTITGTVATNYQSPGAYLTTAALSQDSSKYAGTNGAITGGSITVNTSGVSVNLPAYLTTAMASNRGSDFVQATAAFAGTNASGTIASSGISVSVNAGGGDAIRGIAANGSTATTNTVLFSDANGVSFGFGAAGNSTVLTATVKTDYLTSQSTQFLALTLGGNTAGTTTFHASNNATLFFHGGNNITLSGNGSSVTISGANAGGAQTGISGVVVSDTTYTSGTISFSNAGNITISSSVNGATQYVRLSGNAAQTTQSAIKAFGVSDTGQTAGDTGVSTGIDWVLAGSQSITLSQSTTAGGPNTVWVQHPAWLTTAMASNRGSDFVQATGVFNGTNASGTIASGAISVSVAAPVPIATAVNAVASANSTGTVTRYAPEDHRHAGVGGIGISTSGNTAGTTGSQVGTYWIEGGNSITVSQITSNNGSHTLRLSVGNYLTTAALSGDTSKYVQAWELTGNTAGTTSSAQGTKLYFDGGNSITVSGNSNTIKLSVGNYLTTADLSQNSSKYVQNWKLTGNTAGTTSSAQGTDLWFEGGNSITVSGNSNTIKLSVGNYLTTAALSGDTTKYMQAWELTGNTAGTTSSAQGTKVYFEGGNSITVSGNSNTIKLSVGNYITSQSTQFLAITLGGNTAGTTTFHATNNASIFLHGGNNVTLSGNGSSITISGGAGGGSINVSAGTTSNNLTNITFADSNGVSFGINASTITATVSTYDTVGTATTVYSVASANSVGTVTRWAAEDHRHAGIGGIGISTGNTSGTSGSVLGTYWLAGSNSVTVSQITSNNGSHTLVISGASQPYVGWLEPYGQTNTALFAPGAGSWYLVPFVAPGSISGGRINFLTQNTGTAQLFRDMTAAYVSSSTGGQQQGYTFSLAAALFSQGTGANTTRMESCWSNSFSWAWTKLVSVSLSGASQINISLGHTISYITEIDASGAYALGSFSSQRSSTVANSSTASDWGDTVFASGRNIVSGSVVYPVGLNTTLSGGAYWLGFAWSTTRSNASTGTRISTALDFSHSSMVGISQLELNTLYRNWGSTATTARSQLMPQGLYTAAANMVPPTNIAFSSDLSSLASQWVPYFNLQLRGITK